jgi:hypothetical protein
MAHAVRESAGKPARTQLRKLVMIRAWLQKHWNVISITTERMWFVVEDYSQVSVKDSASSVPVMS